jgi:hypothetical protein
MRHEEAWSIVAPWLFAAATAQQEAWRVSGASKCENLGRAIAIVEDHDGDGNANRDRPRSNPSPNL